MVKLVSIKQIPQKLTKRTLQPVQIQHHQQRLTKLILQQRVVILQTKLPQINQT